MDYTVMRPALISRRECQSEVSLCGDSKFGVQDREGGAARDAVPLSFVLTPATPTSLP
jgi:hypothetical protein